LYSLNDSVSVTVWTLEALGTPYFARTRILRILERSDLTNISYNKNLAFNSSSCKFLFCGPNNIVCALATVRCIKYNTNNTKYLRVLSMITINRGGEKVSPKNWRYPLRNLEDSVQSAWRTFSKNKKIVIELKRMPEHRTVLNCLWCWQNSSRTGGSRRDIIGITGRWHRRPRGDGVPVLLDEIGTR